MDNPYQKVFIYHYNLADDRTKWQLTLDEHEAQQIDPHYRLSSLKDLSDWVSITSEIFSGSLATLEGKCTWIEYDDYSSYEIVSDWTLEEIHNDAHLQQIV